MNTLTRLDGR